MSVDGFATLETDDGDDPVVRISGEVDLATSPMLRARLDEAVARAARGRVTVDCTGLAFIDSTGLRALVEAADRLTGADRAGGMALVGVSPGVAKIFEIAGIGHLLTIVLGESNGDTG
jgi:anti-sigma B factor antagonist